jgi:diaminopimelate decarboxylase
MQELLERIAREFGTPCFVYDFRDVVSRIETIRRAFCGRFQISYAMKCNPNPAIVRRLSEKIEWLDISSGGELALAGKNGWDPARMSFTGPAKRDAELALAVDARVGAIVLESTQEAERLDKLSAKARIVQPVLIRIAPSKMPPGFGVHMAGKPSHFGIDEEEIDPAIKQIISLPHLRLCGFHIYAGTQCLREEVIVESYAAFISIFQRVCESHNICPEKLIFGSGLGIPYYEQDKSLNLAAIAQRVNPLLDDLRQQPAYSKTDLILETGRFLIGPAGFYLTSVVSTKRSRGTEIRICDGGMNHHLGACGHLGSVIHRNYRMFKLGAEDASGEQGRYDLFGPLCTSIDMLGHGVLMSKLEMGDIIAICNSGAYGLTASPIHFISHPPAREILVGEGGSGETLQDISGA